MKRVISIILTLTFLLSLVPFSIFASDGESSSFYLKYDPIDDAKVFVDGIFVDSNEFANYTTGDEVTLTFYRPDFYSGSLVITIEEDGETVRFDIEDIDAGFTFTPDSTKETVVCVFWDEYDYLYETVTPSFDNNENLATFYVSGAGNVWYDPDTLDPDNILFVCGKPQGFKVLSKDIESLEIHLSIQEGEELLYFSHSNDPFTVNEYTIEDFVYDEASDSYVKELDLGTSGYCFVNAVFSGDAMQNDSFFALEFDDHFVSATLNGETIQPGYYPYTILSDLNFEFAATDEFEILGYIVSSNNGEEFHKGETSLSIDEASGWYDIRVVTTRWVEPFRNEVSIHYDMWRDAKVFVNDEYVEDNTAIDYGDCEEISISLKINDWNDMYALNPHIKVFKYTGDIFDAFIYDEETDTYIYTIHAEGEPISVEIIYTYEGFLYETTEANEDEKMIEANVDGNGSISFIEEEDFNRVVNFYGNCKAIVDSNTSLVHAVITPNDNASIVEIQLNGCPLNFEDDENGVAVIEIELGEDPYCNLFVRMEESEPNSFFIDFDSSIVKATFNGQSIYDGEYGYEAGETLNFEFDTYEGSDVEIVGCYVYINGSVEYHKGENTITIENAVGNIHIVVVSTRFVEPFENEIVLHYDMWRDVNLTVNGEFVEDNAALWYGDSEEITLSLKVNEWDDMYRFNPQIIVHSSSGDINDSFEYDEETETYTYTFSAQGEPIEVVIFTCIEELQFDTLRPNENEVLVEAYASGSGFVSIAETDDALASAFLYRNFRAIFPRDTETVHIIAEPDDGTTIEQIFVDGWEVDFETDENGCALIEVEIGYSDWYNVEVRFSEPEYSEFALRFDSNFVTAYYNGDTYYEEGDWNYNGGETLSFIFEPATEDCEIIGLIVYSDNGVEYCKDMSAFTIEDAHGRYEIHVVTTANPEPFQNEYLVRFDDGRCTVSVNDTYVRYAEVYPYNPDTLTLVVKAKDWDNTYELCPSVRVSTPAYAYEVMMTYDETADAYVADVDCYGQPAVMDVILTEEARNFYDTWPNPEEIMIEVYTMNTQGSAEYIGENVNSVVSYYNQTKYLIVRPEDGKIVMKITPDFGSRIESVFVDGCYYEIDNPNEETFIEFELNDSSVYYVDVNFVGGAEDVKLGDLNQDGKVNAVDASILTKMITGLVAGDDYTSIVGDMNGDSKINSVDLQLLQRVIVGI